jgi:thioesterase domain-containing protein
LIYTSGSTGTPKGVMVEHRGLPNLAIAQIRTFSVEPDSRILQFASFNFDASVSEVAMALLGGACLYIPRRGVILAGDPLAKIVAEHRITHATLPPAVLATLTKGRELDSLRVLIVAGEALPDSLASQWVEGRRLINAYGPTETTIWAAGHECRVEQAGKPPIGRPMANARIYILNRHGEAAPMGVAGELYIGGVGVARGYWKRPEMTAEHFLPDPYAAEAGDRIYRTGDVGRWLEDRNIEFLGRNDFQVKIRGFRIELGEIEARLAKRPGVREAVVIMREDTPGDKRLVAYYTVAELDGDQTGKDGAVMLNAESLRTHLAATLPEYMVPAAYVLLKRLPLTVNGKLARKALPKPEGDAYGAREYESPQGTTEIILAGIWADLLGVERVGRRDNFFDLGGHSLLAVRAIARIQQQLKIEAALKDLFTCPQLHSFAALFALPRNQDAERAIPIREKGAELPLFFPHGADDEAGYAWAIAPYIDSRIPIYELPAQKNEGSRLRTIEGQAQRMVKMIRDVQPVGPYRIVGYCFGSFLAYEIAKQLIGADEEVFLGLLDFRVVFGNTDDEPLVTSTAVNQDPKMKFLSAVSDHAAASNLPASVHQAVTELRQSSHNLEEAFYHCKHRGWVPEPWMHLTPARLEKLLTHLVDMERCPYFFSALPIDVHMFVAQDERSAADLPDHFAALVPGATLRSIPVPGTHDTMVQNPNVKQLGPSLGLGIEEASKNKASATPIHSVVSLTDEGLSTQDRGIPLFCVPAIGLSAMCFAGLGSALNGARPIYGFRARGLSEGAIPHTTVEAAASFYLKELNTVCSRGPVHLLGHLGGGWIAFEMALMLHAAGRNVLSLTLLQSEPPEDESSHGVRDYTVSEVVGNWLDIIGLSTGRSPVTLADLEREGPARQRQILRQLMVDCGLLPIESATGDLYRLLQILGIGLRTRYIPQRAYPGTIHLVLADERRGPQENLAKSETTAIRWQRWGSGVVECHSPGNHMTMLKLPHVLNLADIIEAETKRSDRDVLTPKAATA